jgi:hypothetical protein
VALLDARAALADPAVAVAEAALDVARRVDPVRHEVPRGPAQVAAATEALALADALTRAVTALRTAAADLDAELTGQREAAEALADLGADTAAAVRADLEGLAAHVDHDAAVDALVAGWRTRGSRGEIVAAFDRLVADAERLAGEAAALPPSPPGCSGLRDNRVAWTALVVARTRELRDVAATFDGSRFDELEARYALAPRGEDPVAADAENRPCWAAATPLLGTEAAVREAVGALETALNR